MNKIVVLVALLASFSLSFHPENIYANSLKNMDKNSEEIPNISVIYNNIGKLFYIEIELEKNAKTQQEADRHQHRAQMLEEISLILEYLYID